MTPAGRHRCIIILSAKSSGSSMLQRLLCTDGRVNVVGHTRHSENETLYWTKAASILGLPQVRMLDSEVPLSAARAKQELTDFLAANLGATPFPALGDRASLFEGWRRLCARHEPVFLEKSPHHLLQWSALELIAQCMRWCEDIDFLVVGLVRNPMDTIYSAWRRWQIYPEAKEHEWLAEYDNLLKSRRLFGDRLTILRYEDLVDGTADLRPLCQTLSLDDLDLDSTGVHGRSIQKWRDDPRYAFTLSAAGVELAGRFGYGEDTLENPNQRRLWFLYRNLTRLHGRTRRLARHAAVRAVEFARAVPGRAD